MPYKIGSAGLKFRHLSLGASIILVLSGTLYGNVIPYQGYIFFVVPIIFITFLMIINGWCLRWSKPLSIQLVLVSTYLLFTIISILLFSHDIKYGVGLLSSTLLALTTGGVLSLYLLGNFKFSFIAWILFANSWLAVSFIAYFYAKYGLLLRSTGKPIVDSNINGIGLSIVIGLASFGLTVMMDERVKKKNVVLLILSLPFFILGILVTYSRASIAMLILTLIMFLYFIVRKHLLVSLCSMLLLLAVIPSLHVDISDKLKNTLIDRIESRINNGELREHVYNVGIDMIIDSPIFGIGFSNFSEFFHAKTHLKAVRAHNDYFESFVELGFIGGISYLVIVLFSSWYWFSSLHNSQNKPLAFTFFLLLVYSLVRPMQMLILWWFFLFIPLVKLRR